jgi:hypothetical protein
MIIICDCPCLIQKFYLRNKFKLLYTGVSEFQGQTFRADSIIRNKDRTLSSTSPVPKNCQNHQKDKNVN